MSRLRKPVALPFRGPYFARMNMTVGRFGSRPGVIALALLLPLVTAAQPLPSVPAPRQPVTNTYHGLTLTDDYQWLENASAPEVREWTRQENERTRAFFTQLPYREGIAQQLMQLRSEESARYSSLDWKQGRIFALRFKPPAQQPLLIRLSSLEPPALWKTVFDPNTYDTNGSTAIDWFVPSPDGKRVATSLSEGGSEQGTLHFFEVDTGKELSDQIPRVQYPTGGGSSAWTADGSGVYYTRYPHAGERPEADLNFYQQIWFHRLGTPVSETDTSLAKTSPALPKSPCRPVRMAAGCWLRSPMAMGASSPIICIIRPANGNRSRAWRTA
jgi:prolyl oligopeptidase